LLETGEIDLSFSTPPIQITGIAGIELWKDEIFLAVHPSHHFAERGKISLIEASNEAYISLKAGCSIRFTLEHACKSAFSAC
jgi:DNA-binding transcriptional LysR family regulator